MLTDGTIQKIVNFENRFNAYVVANCPDVWLRSSLFKLSPVPDAAIEFGFIGDDIDTLRRLTQAAGYVLDSSTWVPMSFKSLVETAPLMAPTVPTFINTGV